MKRAAIAAALALSLAVPAAADVIRLKSGQTIQGEVLKEVEGTLYVDLGVDVVRVPKEDVLSREKGDASAPVPVGNVRKQNIYSTATLPGGSVKSLA
ncbi:MAG TPA: peptidase S1, partial [Planctomycetaceae bacterium]